MVGLLIGVAVGIVSGIIGIGGGVMVVPILVYGFKYTQQTAQGTSLAMILPPVGILAVLQYWRAGHVDVKMAVLLALGFAVGGYFGGHWAQQMSSMALRRAFAVTLGAVAVKMFFQK
jgi:uncharacterized membrane protein YfcA